LVVEADRLLEGPDPRHVQPWPQMRMAAPERVQETLDPRQVALGGVAAAQQPRPQLVEDRVGRVCADPSPVRSVPALDVDACIQTASQIHAGARGGVAKTELRLGLDPPAGPREARQLAQALGVTGAVEVL